MGTPILLQVKTVQIALSIARNKAKSNKLHIVNT